MLGQPGGQIVCQANIEAARQRQGLQNVNVGEAVHNDDNGPLEVAEARLRPPGYGAAAFAKGIVSLNFPYVFLAGLPSRSSKSEGWWTTSPFSTNEEVLNLFCEQTFRVLNMNPDWGDKLPEFYNSAPRPY